LPSIEPTPTEILALDCGPEGVGRSAPSGGSPHLSRRGWLASLLVFPVLVLPALLACDRNIEAYEPGEEPSPPDLARIFPQPERERGAAASNEGGGRMGSAAAAKAGSATSAATAARVAPRTAANRTGETGVVRGRIEVGAGQSPGASSEQVLFVIARRSGAAGGPPLAVQRIDGPDFSSGAVAFEIGQAQVMIPSLEFAGDITLSARLDSDGNAMTKLPGDLTGALKLPGDLTGALPDPVRPGQEDILITLDQAL